MTKGVFLNCVFILSLAIIGLLSYTTLTYIITQQTKVDAFKLVNGHNGLSDWGLKQLDQLLDQKK